LLALQSRQQAGGLQVTIPKQKTLLDNPALPEFYLHFPTRADSFRPYRMSKSDSDGSQENEWEDRGDLAWNEFDWERYLREQDETVRRYLTCYEKLKGHPDRIDETAHLMGWNEAAWNSDSSDQDTPEIVAEDANDEGPADYDDFEPYTLHKNPVFIATKAIYLGLKRSWEAIAADPSKVPQALALSFQTSLHRGEEQAGLAIQALDLG